MLRVHTLLLGGNSLHGRNHYGARANLKPIIPELETVTFWELWRALESHTLTHSTTRATTTLADLNVATLYANWL